MDKNTLKQIAENNADLLTERENPIWQVAFVACKNGLEIGFILGAEEKPVESSTNSLHKHFVMPSLLEIDFNKMRKAKGLTLREVEKNTGISNAYLSQLETGKIKSPGYNVVKVLLELYSNEA